MADNLNVSNPAVAQVAYDNISDVLYPRTKVVFGVDGSATDVSSSNPLPVTGGSSEVEFNSTLPTLTNGQKDTPQSDANGITLVREKYAAGYEDNVNNKAIVEQRNAYASISTATTTTITGAKFIHQIRVVGGTMGTVTVYDNTAASGTVVVPTVTPAQGQVLIEDVLLGTGLTIVTGAATVLTISYRT